MLDEVKKNAFNTIKLKIKLANLNETLVSKLDTLLNLHEGKSNVEFYLEDEEQHQNIKLFSKKNKIAIDNEFLLELDKFQEVNYELN